MGQTKFEEKVGWSRGFINKLSGNTTIRSLEKIKAVYPELNMEWLIFGDGEMLKSAPAAVTPNPAAQPDTITMPREVWEEAKSDKAYLKKLLEEKNELIKMLVGNGAGKERRTFVVTEEEGAAALG